MTIMISNNLCKINSPKFLGFQIDRIYKYFNKYFQMLSISKVYPFKKVQCIQWNMSQPNKNNEFY